MPPLSAVVMAAGEGRRMRPLSDRWAKPMLPIDGRPVIATLVRELGAAGFGEATVVVGHLAAQIEELLGDGSGFGVQLTYALQTTATGSADAVRCAVEAGARPPLLVTAADMVFSRGDLERACSEWLDSGADAGLGVRRTPSGQLAHQTPVRVEGGRVVELGGPPVERDGSVLTGAPVWLFGTEIVASLDELPGPPFELGTALSRALDAGRTVRAIELGPTRDVTRPEDVVARNFPYLSRWGRGGTEE